MGKSYFEVLFNLHQGHLIKNILTQNFQTSLLNMSYFKSIHNILNKTEIKKKILLYLVNLCIYDHVKYVFKNKCYKGIK